ncbi:MAG: hypothetical protein ACOC4E_02895, partial [Patescibacteria group bacterium]
PIDQPTVADFAKEYTSSLERFDFQGASNFVWRKVQDLDEKITATEPFKLVKVDKPAAQELIASLALDLYLIAQMLHPLMPAANETIKAAVLANKKPENLFARLDA